MAVEWGEVWMVGLGSVWAVASSFAGSVSGCAARMVCSGTVRRGVSRFCFWEGFGFGEPKENEPCRV